jgi:hypothetical protein
MSVTEEFLKKRLVDPYFLVSPWDVKRYRVRPPLYEEAAALPPTWLDYLPYLEEEYDQGEMGTCVGHGFKVALQSMLKIMKAPPLSIPASNRLTLIRKHRKGLTVNFAGVEAVPEVSAWSIYQWSRRKANIPSFIEGSTALGACKALHDWGACTEDCWPTPMSWDDPRAEAEPCADCEVDGEPQEQMERAIDSYWQVGTTPGDIMAAMYGVTHPAPYNMPDGSPGKMAIPVAIPIYTSFTEQENGVVPLPKADDVLLGGHLTPLVGWDQVFSKNEDGTGGTKLHYLNQGTWGNDVGDDGKFWIPHDYPIYEAWVIHIGPPTVPEPSPCEYGNALAAMLNIGLAFKGRKGRFQYVNPGR